MALRFSSKQFTVLRSIAQKPLAFERAVELNQVTFYRLLDRGYLSLDEKTEVFHLTQEGLTALDEYRNGSIGNMVVKNNPPERQKKVSSKLGIELPQEPPAQKKPESPGLKRARRSMVAKMAHAARKIAR